MKYGSWTLGQIEALLNKVGEENARGLLRDKARIRSVRKATYHVTIKSFDAMFMDGGYGYKSNGITREKFPFTNKEGDTEELALIRFGGDISSEDAVKKMVEMGLEPGRTEHLMAYGVQHWPGPLELVVALGSPSVSQGVYKSVTCLCGHRGDRSLSLEDWDGRWGADCGFLAVHKS